ncbi:tRNA pseudouridine synthase 3 [Mycena kentingensis (nom. inval.)]|nr:tRNA pseudouridine synthase 3 [Mycena kentingensis (nom. inval.)]
MSSSYDSWSKQDLIAKLVQLEASTSAPPPPSTQTNASSSRRDFDFSSYPRRKIALKFCYSGWEYNGLAIQTDPTPLPTVEGVLFDALAKARLIDPTAGMEGCEWERCGRTDRGVSAAGQVVSLWVRSALNPKKLGSTIEPEEIPPIIEPPPETEGSVDGDDLFPSLSSLDISTKENHNRPRKTNLLPNPNRPEHNFPAILNRLLPSTIRVLAWSPVAPDFSSRFACTSRHYKYFFASSSNLGAASGTVDLDVGKMQEAASLLVGGHDFRNFCKIDAAKQLTEYKRRIIRAKISPASVGAGMYVFDLVGSAFLYHQVRHIMAILFLVGAGLEQPSLVSSLLRVEPDPENPTLPVFDTKPEYQMADGLPLMLYACHYPDNLLDWRVSGDDSAPSTRKPAAVSRDSIPNQNSDSDASASLQYALARSQMYATLNNAFCEASEAHYPLLPHSADVSKLGAAVPLGGSYFRRTHKYVPVLERKRNEHFEVVNARWRAGKGARREERKGQLSSS